jgi:hypothetical protein
LEIILNGKSPLTPIFQRGKLKSPFLKGRLRGILPYANLLDYTIDETTGQVVSGSKTEPVKFEEYWTFTLQVRNNPWQLSAINQAE